MWVAHLVLLLSERLLASLLCWCARRSQCWRVALPQRWLRLQLR